MLEISTDSPYRPGADLKENPMALREKLTEAMKDAMKAKDAKRLATVRMMLAALKDRDIAARTETSRDLLGDDEILSLLAKMIKQREESAAVYVQGGRPELAENEKAEIAIIREFMPRQMDEPEARAAIAAVVAELGATSVKDMGKVMGTLKERYAGQMDFGRASGHVKEALTPK
ncbi:MAG TPA: GatB/YqeY domain-containing protein, partial [Rhizomicrobium sp.]